MYRLSNSRTNKADTIIVSYGWSSAITTQDVPVPAVARPKDTRLPISNMLSLYEFSISRMLTSNVQLDCATLV